MVIYAEFMFLENAVSGAVILLIVERLCGCARRRKLLGIGILLGSIMCGAYSFILFVKLNWGVALLGKLAFSVSVVAVAFMPETRRGFIKTTIVFYLVSFLMGGVTIALMYITGAQGMSANGSVYCYGATYLQVASGILVTAVFGIWLADHLKERADRREVISQAAVHIGDRIFEMTAFVDTGNFLKEPVTGYPAALVSKSTAEKIVAALGYDTSPRCCVIPYKSIGKSGILYGLRPDLIEVCGKRIEKVVIAFGETDFAPWNGTDKYDILLQQQMIKGGSDDEEIGIYNR